jgi:multiple sugar transport system ATP-binding protein
MNTINVTLVDEGGVTYAEFGDARIALPESKGRKPEVLAYAGQEVIMGIRPENIHDEEMFLNMHPDSLVTTDVEVVEQMGNENFLYLVCNGKQMTARVSNRSTAKNGDTIKVAFDTSKIHLFDKDSEKTITN